jgi:MarR family transcriptional regulator, lower aerobic nicotinate degradation pathway regulator
MASRPISRTRSATAGEDASGYALDSQIGFLLRQAQQRHTAIFARLMIEDVTPTQWAALAKLAELGPCSQNLLGRHTAMDAATIKGVVDRLSTRGFVAAASDPADSRRLLIALTEEGRAFVARATPCAQTITEETLAPLNAQERASLTRLIAKIR